MTEVRKEQLCMLKHFPLLIPQNDKPTKFKGFLSAEGEEFFISFNVPNYPSPKGLSMRCTWELNLLLSNHKKQLREWRDQQSSLYIYLECLQNLIISCLQSDKDRQIPKHDSHLSVKSLKVVAQELEALGADNVNYISTTCRTIVVREIDQAGHTHLLTYKLSMMYPNTPPAIEADLPEIALKALKKKSSLSSIYKAFKEEINALQVFWKELDEVDGKCWVLDPEHPTRKDTHRRIMIEFVMDRRRELLEAILFMYYHLANLQQSTASVPFPSGLPLLVWRKPCPTEGNNVSLQVTLDPVNMKELPDMKFLGAERGILPFQMAFAENMKLWSNEKGLLENIKTMLNISEFPSTPSGSEQSNELVHQGECAICVMVQLNGEVPSKSCDSEKCDAIYHVLCLHEWLQTVPTSKKAFNYIIGECPNCFSTISCQKPS